MAELSSNYLSLMSDSLNKKAEVLEAIAGINDNQFGICGIIGNQNEILQAQPFELDDFDATVHQKAELIDQLERLDDGFASLFARVREQLDGRKEQYAGEIKSMQQLIRKVTELSVKVEAQEQRNKVLADKQFSTLKKEVREAKRSTQMASRYYKSMSKVDIAPQFMDKKN